MVQEGGVSGRSKKEYEHAILHGIPSELATFASRLLSSALIVHSVSTVDLDALINQICEEVDRLKTRRAGGQHGQQGKTEQKTVRSPSFMATESKRRRCRGKCRKCGEEGHWARECCTPKREGNATAPVAQASSGATVPPETPVCGGNPHGHRNRSC